MRIGRPTVPIVLFLFSASAVADQAALQKELAETRQQLMHAELDLEKAKQMLPFGPDAADAEQAVRGAAEDARLSRVEVKAVPPAAGPASAVSLRRIEFSGRDAYENVQKFFYRLTVAKAAIGFEDLRLDAAPDRTIAFHGRLVYPALNPPPRVAPRAPASPPASARTPEEQAQAARDAVVRRMIAHERAQLDYARSAAAELRKIARFRAGDTINALAAFAHAMDGRAVALTAIRVSGTTTLTGFAVGGQAANAIRPALENAGFDVEALDLNPGPRCTSFTAAARLAEGERPLEVVLNNGLFDDRAAAICGVPSSAAADVSVRGSDPKGVTLRLRDADSATVLMALHDVSDENFVANDAIARRLNISASNATVAGVLDALRAQGLSMSGGHVHRMPSGAFREQTWSGQPVSLAIRDADLADLLCLLHQVSELPILMRKDLRPKISAFLKEVPWDEALANIIAAAGEQYAIDDNRLFVGTKGGDPAAVDACGAAAAVAGEREWWRGPSRLEDLEASDLALAGVASTDGRWKAYAYGPMRKVWPLESGVKLAGARVRSVGADGATLETDAGNLIPLRFTAK